MSSAGREFEVRSKVIGVVRQGQAGLRHRDAEHLVDRRSGDAYAVIQGSGFFVGQGGWGGPKRPKNPSRTTRPRTWLRRPPVSSYHSTNAESALLYRLNGDYNPLHATPEPGRQMGFGGAIMHGLFSWNSTCQGLLKTLGGSDPANIKEFQCRFASPVKPGDKLVTHMWRLGNPDRDGIEEVRFVTLVAGGKVCLSNGRALMRVVGEKSRL